MAKITITAKSGDKEIKPNDEGRYLVADKAPITLTATVDAGTLEAVAWKRGDQDASAMTEYTASQDSLSFTATGDRFATYTAEGTVDAAQAEPGQITIGLDEAPAKSVEGAPGVVEVAVGEYDPTFAIMGAAVTLVLLGLLTFATIMLLTGADLPSTTLDLGEKHTMVGTYAERSASRIQILVAGLGGVALVAGAFLAALEVRGRLKAPANSAHLTTLDASTPALPTVPVSAEGLAKVLAEFRSMRATVAVLAIGGVLLCASLWASASVADPDGDADVPAVAAPTNTRTDQTDTAPTATPTQPAPATSTPTTPASATPSGQR